MIATRTRPHTSMRNLLRHPRFSLTLLLLLLVALLYLSAVHGTFTSVTPPSEFDSQVTIVKEVKFRPSSTHGSGVQKPLSQRLTDSEAVYQKTLRQRRVLIKRFGPTPKGVLLYVPSPTFLFSTAASRSPRRSRHLRFPPNTPPWPPYTVWDFFPPAFNCPWEVERIGILGDGGKFVCGFSRVIEKPKCVIYSIGINHESSFVLLSTHFDTLFTRPAGSKLNFLNAAKTARSGDTTSRSIRYAVFCLTGQKPA